MGDAVIPKRTVAVSPETAQRVMRMVEAFGTVERAAHEASVQLRAIEPMFDSRLHACIRVLSVMARSEKARATVRAIAEKGVK